MNQPNPYQPAPGSHENPVAPPPELVPALQRMGLCEPEDTVETVALTGGVSSDIWRVSCAGRTFCVKRALAQLKVQQEWQAPISRNAVEAEWLRLAGRLVRGAAPQVLGQDRSAGLFAMAWLPPEDYPLWKARLLAGDARLSDARAVGERLAVLHGLTAGKEDLQRQFATDHIFHPIRLEPYLLAPARRHPDLAGPLRDLLKVTAETRRVVVHGDVSPKNILLGPLGPVFLDGECAWYGDPAFDLAFCLNHLLLKCLARPSTAVAFLACFDVLAATYLAGVGWEPADELERRAARLLPGLFLGRVDGKSPVEYVTEKADKDRVRRTARALLTVPADRLSEVRAAWDAELGAP